MAVNNTHHLAVLAVGGEVQQNFAGALLDAPQLLAVVIDHTAIVRFHEPLLTPVGVQRISRSFKRIEMVAIVSRSKTLVVKPTTDFTDEFPMFRVR